MFGKCALCLNEADLQYTHYMPAGAYKAVAQGHSPHDKQTIKVDFGSNTAVYSNEQPQKHLLCWDCEQRFRKCGEDHVLANCHRKNGKFGLRDALKKAVPSLRTAKGNVSYYDKQVPAQVDESAYVYFAASVFWRGSVTDWPKPYHEYRGKLGKKYEEDFRLFLLHKSEFPKNAHLSVLVDFDVPSQTGVIAPHFSKVNFAGFRLNRHSFMIPGIRFNLLLGGNTEAYLKTAAPLPRDRVNFCEWHFTETSLYKSLSHKSKSLMPKGRLGKK